MTGVTLGIRLSMGLWARGADAKERAEAIFNGGCFWCEEASFEGESVKVAYDPAKIAEEYHQDFYKKNLARYQSYRLSCGRDRRLKELWGASAGH